MDNRSTEREEKEGGGLSKLTDKVPMNVEEAKKQNGGAEVSLFGQESKVRNMVFEIVTPMKTMIKGV